MQLVTAYGIQLQRYMQEHHLKLLLPSTSAVSYGT
jgi:hypothetical protein